MSGILFSAYGREAVALLSKTIGEVKGGDVFSPVTIATPSIYSNLHLRRRLAMGDGSEEPKGLLNVGFIPLSRVAELTGASELSRKGLKPLKRQVSAEILRFCLQETASVFSPFRKHPSTVTSMLASFNSLRMCSEADLKAMETHRSQSVKDLVKVYRDYRRRVDTYGFYDDFDLFRAARDTVARGSAALTDLGHIIVYLPSGLAEHETDFIKALLDAGRATVIIGLTGEEGTDKRSLEIAQSLDATPIADNLNTRKPQPSKIVTVMDEEEEARFALRRVVEKMKEGVALWRMAVLFKNRDPYYQVLFNAFSNAGIPCNGPSGDKLLQSLPGRMLQGLIKITQGGFARKDVVEWLMSSRVCFPGTNDEVYSSWWARISREAGIGKGLESWEKCLARMIAEARTRRGYDEDKHISESDGKQASTLLEFIRELAADLSWNERDFWSAYAAKTKDILIKYGGKVSAESETEGHWKKVFDHLEGLSSLDSIRPEVEFDEFLAAVSDLLESGLKRPEPYGNGVFVGTLDDAAGMDFDEVIILGAVEGQIPTPAGYDPLLPDYLRDDFADILPESRRTIGDEHRTYLTAIAGGVNRTVVYPAATRGEGRTNLPSRWLLEAASEKYGRQVQAEDLFTLPDTEWFRRIASFTHGVAEGEPYSLQIYDAASLIHYIRVRNTTDGHFLTENPLLARKIEAWKNRRSSRLTAWDGVITDAGNRFALSSIVSPKMLEMYACCPYRYYLACVLDVEETAEIKEVFGMSALVKGLAAHDILAEFLKKHLTIKPHESWTEEDKNELRRISTSYLEKLQAEGLLTAGAAGDLVARLFIEDLVDLLSEDDEHRQAGSYQPLFIEKDFNEKDDIGVDMDGRRIRLCGRMDRLDINLDSTKVCVIDYKTGRSKQLGKTQDPLDSGRALQLVIYSIAAGKLTGATDYEGKYFHTPKSAEKRIEHLHINPSILELTAKMVSLIVKGIETGLFPAAPDEDGYGNCTYCPFDRVCPADRRNIWRRKQADNAAENYLRLKTAAADFETTHEEAKN